MPPIKRVAIIGTGPAGAIAIDAFAQEKAFDQIRVFERREKPGGCWLLDPWPHPPLTDFDRLAQRNADTFRGVPETLPTQTPGTSLTGRYAETSVYPLLETNVDDRAMQFSQEPFPTTKSALSIARHGDDVPYRHWSVIQQYVENLVKRNNYEDLVSYNTTVEKATKRGDEWELILRQHDKENDSWWIETFDAVVVASGHFTVPYVPEVKGLAEFEERYPGSVQHSKAYRGPEAYKGKRVVIAGASVSGADIAIDLIGVAESPINCVVKGHRPHIHFGDIPFHNPGVRQLPSIAEIKGRDVHFIDGTVIENVDNLIFGTGYSWSLPFLPQIPIRNNRVPDLYLHIFHQSDPTLTFVGAVAAGLTFKVYEWQAVLAARVLAGRATLPPLEEQKRWEEDRIAYKGDGVAFTALVPDWEEYFEKVRDMAGEPDESQSRPGRKLPKFDQGWVDAFFEGHQRRIRMWEKLNREGAENQQNGVVSAV